MNTKYYTDNIINISKERRKLHKRILRKRIKCACTIVEIISALCIWGLVGGLQNNAMTIKEFILYELVAMTIMWICARINNVIVITKRR